MQSHLNAMLTPQVMMVSLFHCEVGSLKCALVFEAAACDFCRVR